MKDLNTVVNDEEEKQNLQKMKINILFNRTHALRGSKVFTKLRDSVQKSESRNSVLTGRSNRETAGSEKDAGFQKYNDEYI